VLLVTVFNVHSRDDPPNYPTVYKYSHFISFTKSLTIADKVEQRIDNIEKSNSDSRIYRGLVLKNGLTALLISDPDTDISAASLSVAVGKF